MLAKSSKGRAYCNTCRRFVSEAHDEVRSHEVPTVVLFLSPAETVHKGHELVQIALPSEFDSFTNDDLNILLRLGTKFYRMVKH